MSENGSSVKLDKPALANIVVGALVDNVGKQGEFFAVPISFYEHNLTLIASLTLTGSLGIVREFVSCAQNALLCHSYMNIPQMSSPVITLIL